MSKKKIHCGCGHVNPHGTEICESCGKPFDNHQKGLLNMRYEGAARRSQTYQKTIVDRIWNFFASVRVGIWLLVITLLASMLGTVYPQEMYIPSNEVSVEYYTEQYGTPGYIYVMLGFHHLYSSWWYVTLLVLIGVSLTVSSIDRIIPLYRSLKRQRIPKHRLFMQRQRISVEAEEPFSEEKLDKAKDVLQKQRYNVRQKDQALMGEKGRFSRWGPYVVHLGLIILLLGALMRILPGFTLDDYVWVRDGETVPVPGTNNQYYVESEGFTLDLYEEDEMDLLVPEEFVTEAILYENVMDEESGESTLQEVKKHTIIVNDPLEYDQLKLYQADYILNEFSEFSFEVIHKETDNVIGEVEVDLYDPEPHYEVGDGHEVEIVEYFPDFVFDEQNEPATQSNIPHNPAFIFKVVSPDQPNGETSMLLLGQRIEMPDADNEYELSISDIEFNNVTGLMVRKELSLPVIYTGLGITMIGLVLCFYWQHRRIWIQYENDQVYLAAHTNKNWFGLRREVENIIDETALPLDKESLDKEEN